MNVTLSMTIDQHEVLRHHLFPGDGLEAAALLLCGGSGHGDRYRLSVRDVVLLDHDKCKRLDDRISWPTDLIIPHLDHAEELGLSVVKVHCHPGNFPQFSEVDDVGDRELLPVVARGSAPIFLTAASSCNPVDGCLAAIFGKPTRCGRWT